jgi:chromosome segregation ATPase
VARIETQQAALAAQAAEMAAALDAHAQLASVVDSLGRRVDRAQERVRDRLNGLSQRVDEASATITANASKEAGALAPLRSDVRMLQAQVAALAETVESLPRRKAPVKAAPPPRIAAVKAEARRRARTSDQ